MMVLQSVEMQMLLFAVILGIIELMVASQAMTAQRGFKWNISSREGNPKELTGAAGRIDRAFKNYKETFSFFVAAVLVVHVTGKSGELSQWGAGIYLVARVLHFLVYAAGITYLRSLIWLASMAGILMIVAQGFS